MTRSVTEILDRAVASCPPTREELVRLLEIRRDDERQALFQAAYQVKKKHVGAVVYFRGLIEVSNKCQKDCLYCGIRHSNPHVERFSLTSAEIVAAARWAHANRYGSLVLQAGELQSDHHTEFISTVLRQLHDATNGELAVTLSMGEQKREVLRAWRQAGAHRYLLRLETTQTDLYQNFHPTDHLWQARLQCLADLRSEGYQVGTGVMIGLPGQTSADLAADLLYIRDLDVDMIGMGPFIPHRDTPLANHLAGFDKAAGLDLGLKMLACARLLLPDANMAATTALQALDNQGRELGLRTGANIVMPNVTDPKHRRAYQLYDGKPSLDENSEQSRVGLEKRICSIGETIGYGQWGSSPRFMQRTAR